MKIFSSYILFLHIDNGKVRNTITCNKIFITIWFFLKWCFVLYSIIFVRMEGYIIFNMDVHYASLSILYNGKYNGWKASRFVLIKLLIDRHLFNFSTCCCHIQLLITGDYSLTVPSDLSSHPSSTAPSPPFPPRPPQWVRH